MEHGLELIIPRLEIFGNWIFIIFSYPNSDQIISKNSYFYSNFIENRGFSKTRLFGHFRAPGPRKSCSRLGAVLFSANFALMGANSIRKRPPEACGWPKMSLQIGARCLNKLVLDPQNGSQHRSKIGLHHPEASRCHREPFVRHLGSIVASCWAPRGLMFELFRGARLLLLACCSSIAGALFLLRPLLHCSPSEPPGYEAQVTKAIASWPRSLVASCLRSSGGRRQEGVAP